MILTSLFKIIALQNQNRYFTIAIEALVLNSKKNLVDINIILNSNMTYT